MQSLFNVYLELDSVVAICFIILARKPKAKKKKIWTDKPHLLSKGEKGVSRENKSKKKHLTKLTVVAPLQQEISLCVQYNQSACRL